MSENTLPNVSNHKWTYDTPKQIKDIPDYLHINTAYILHSNFGKTLGDILTVIDVLGLPTAQDKALKTQIKDKFYKRFRDGADALIKQVFVTQDIIEPASGQTRAVYMLDNTHITGHIDLPTEK